MTAEYGITLQTLIHTPTITGTAIEQKDIACHMAWKQVFGNAYVMESEREQVYPAESMYRAGLLPLRDFIRALASSATYRRRFFECCSPSRAVELNFKHLLGRGPNSQQELSHHVQIIATKGFQAEIDSYIDSEEYEEAFGDDYIPAIRFKGTYRTANEFNRMCTLFSSPGTTDKSLVQRARYLQIENPNRVLSLDGAGYSSKMSSMLALNSPPSFISVKKAIPTRPDLDIGRAAKVKIINENAVSRRRIEITPGNYMFLTTEELEEFHRESSEALMVSSYAKQEVAEARKQIEILQSKIAKLSLVM